MALKSLVLKDGAQIELRGLERAKDGVLKLTLLEGSERELPLDEVDFEATLLANAPQPASEQTATEVLELKALTHDVKGDYLVVEGLVRNVSESDQRNLVAKITGLDESDVFVTSEEVLLDFNPLSTDAESPFKAVVKSSGRIRSVKVQFRYLLGDPVPHGGVESTLSL